MDQSAGMQVIEALSEVYGDEPNVIGGFIGSSRCPSFLEGMYFDGATLVFQVRGDTVQARRTLEQVAGSGAFRLERMTEGNYSQQQLTELMEVVRRRKERLDDEQLAANVVGYGVGLRHLEVDLILNTPEARRAFREKILDSPALRFNGPEEPEPNPMVGVTDTLGVSLRPEYSVYSTRSETALFILQNRSGREVCCGDPYFITYEDEQGTWRTLPINTAFHSVAYGIALGGHHQFTAHLCPKVHSNKPGRYRLLYNVSFGLHGKDFTMMTEFRLTDNEQEVKQAVRTVIADTDSVSRHIPVDTDQDDVAHIYEVVEQMPEFPDGGMKGLREYLRTHLRYPEAARRDSVQGRVIVQFVVMEDGSIGQEHVVRSCGPELDEEALRLVRSMPRWEPGRQNGKAVKVKYVIPVTFRLEQMKTDIP